MPCSNRTSAIISSRDVPAYFPTEYDLRFVDCSIRVY